MRRQKGTPAGSQEVRRISDDGAMAMRAAGSAAVDDAPDQPAQVGARAK